MGEYNNLKSKMFSLLTFSSASATDISAINWFQRQLGLSFYLGGQLVSHKEQWLRKRTLDLGTLQNIFSKLEFLWYSKTLWFGWLVCFGFCSLCLPINPFYSFSPLCPFYIFPNICRRVILRSLCDNGLSMTRKAEEWMSQAEEFCPRIRYK